MTIPQHHHDEFKSVIDRAIADGVKVSVRYFLPPDARFEISFEVGEQKETLTLKVNEMREIEG